MFIRSTYLFLAAWIDTVDVGPIIHKKDVNKHCNWTQYPPDNYCTPENYKMKWKKPTIWRCIS